MPKSASKCQSLFSGGGASLVDTVVCVEEGETSEPTSAIVSPARIASRSHSSP